MHPALTRPVFPMAVLRVGSSDVGWSKTHADVRAPGVEGG
jgi:hypothetical protein